MNSTHSHADSKQSAALDRMLRERQKGGWHRGAKVMERPFATPERIDELAVRLRPEASVVYCVGDFIHS